MKREVDLFLTSVGEAFPVALGSSAANSQPQLSVKANLFEFRIASSAQWLGAVNADQDLLMMWPAASGYNASDKANDIPDRALFALTRRCDVRGGKLLASARLVDSSAVHTKKGSTWKCVQLTRISTMMRQAQVFLLSALLRSFHR